MLVPSKTERSSEADPFSGATPVSAEKLWTITLDVLGRLAQDYVASDRKITPDNVYQPAIRKGRAQIEAYMQQLMLAGSQIIGLDTLDAIQSRIAEGQSVLLLFDHLGNFDVPLFNALLNRHRPRFDVLQEKLVYIAGRKLNESSDLVKMFTEKYARLVIVPRGELSTAEAGSSSIDAEANAINRSAFRQLIRLRREGHAFVLFPLGKRYRLGEDIEGVPETTAYIKSFDLFHLVSMTGNPLPVKEVMEEEKPRQARVRFRVGDAHNASQFLTRCAQEYAVKSNATIASSTMLSTTSSTQRSAEAAFTVQRVLEALDALRGVPLKEAIAR